MVITTTRCRHPMLDKKREFVMTTTEIDVIDDGIGIACSFCGQSQEKVKKLIAGPNVYTCEECVALMVDIIREEVDPNFMVKSINLEMEQDGKPWELVYLLRQKKLAWIIKSEVQTIL